MNGAETNTSSALRILLVEDHDGVAKACRRLLMSHGHFVVCAPSLAAATRWPSEPRSTWRFAT